MAEKTRTVKVLKNAKHGKEVLLNVHVYGDIVPRIREDAVLSPLFSSTFKVYDEIYERVKSASCSNCQLGKEGPVLMLTFVKDLKACPEDKRAAVHEMLGNRTWTSHKQMWINVVSNEVEKQIFEEREVPAPEKSHGQLQQSQAASSGASQAADDIRQLQPRVQSQAQAKPRKLLFENYQAPGDIVMMTAAIRDLHRSHPGKFITDIRTNSMSIWEGNEYITKLDPNDPEVTKMRLEYPLVHQSNQGPYHFTEAFTEELENKLGIRIGNRLCKGYIKMRPEEEVWGHTERATWFGHYGLGGDIHYWIINAGWKNDFTCKRWPAGRYQKVVDHFEGRIKFVQIGHKDHNHPQLENVINLAGETEAMEGKQMDDRQLIRLVWASAGVLTPCSYPMVLAAAVPVRPGTVRGLSERPCVVVAGGREPAGWQAYNSHQFIHTCGMLPCCANGGCWKSRVKPIGDGDHKDKKNMCQHVVTAEDGEDLPFCMDMITADEVIRRIEMYYRFFSADRPKTKTYNE